MLKEMWEDLRQALSKHQSQDPSFKARVSPGSVLDQIQGDNLLGTWEQANIGRIKTETHLDVEAPK